MTKKRKEQVSDENKKPHVSKAKKSTRRKTYNTGKSDLAESNKCSPEVTTARMSQECKENGQESTKTEHWAPDADISSAERDKEMSYERKDLNNMNVLSQAQSMDRDISHTTGSTEQNVAFCSELLQSGDLLVEKVEDPQNKMIPHYDGLSETQDIKMLNQERIRKLNGDNASSGLVGSLEGTGTTSILQGNLHQKPEEAVYFLPHTPDKTDVDGLKKKAFSLVPFKCPLIQETSINMLVEGKATGNTKDNQCEELLGCSDVSMEQDKAVQDIKMSNIIRKEIRNENGSRNDAGPVDCMTNKNESKSNTHQIPLVRDISTPGPRGQNKNLDACTMSREGSADSKEANQTATNVSKKPEEHYICNNTEICMSAMSEKNTEPRTNPVLENTRDQNRAQSSSYKEESITAEQNGILIKNVPGKIVPETWVACSSLGNDTGISGPKCELDIKTGDLFFPQLDKNIKKSGQTVCRDESRLVEKARMEEMLGKSSKVSTVQDVPSLLTQQQKLNNSEKVGPDTKQLQVINFDSEPSKKVEALSSTDIFKQNFFTETNIRMDGKEAMMVIHEESESKSVNMELGLSSEVLPVLVTDDPSEINAGSKAQRSPHVQDPGFIVSAPNDLDTGTQRCSPCTDPSSLHLEFLPESQLQALYETHSLEFPSHKRPVLDNLHSHLKIRSDPCAAEKQNEIKTSPSVVLVNHPNPRDEVTKMCDLCKQEDATGIVCGLIKELSNLNRLIMNTHRELDSFKRSKLQRNRQLGKFLPHNMNAMISTRFTAKKRKELQFQE